MMQFPTISVLGMASEVFIFGWLSGHSQMNLCSSHLILSLIWSKNHSKFSKAGASSFKASAVKIEIPILLITSLHPPMQVLLHFFITNEIFSYDFGIQPQPQYCNVIGYKAMFLMQPTG